MSCGATAIPRGLGAHRRRRCWRRQASPMRSRRWPHPIRRWLPAAAPSATPCRAMNFRTSSSSSIGCWRRRCAPLRCGPWARSATSSRSRASWTNWPRRPASSPWPSGCRICAMRGRAPSWSARRPWRTGGGPHPRLTGAGGSPMRATRIRAAIAPSWLKSMSPESQGRHGCGSPPISERSSIPTARATRSRAERSSPPAGRSRKPCASAATGLNAAPGRPEAPPLGAGELAQGPTAAAIGNALHAALGVRVRQTPFTRERILAAMEP
jgi:hypothetical protein